jgi:tagatose 6-phosphate kinase
MAFRKMTLDAVNRAVTTVDGAAGKSINVAKVLKALGERPLATGFLGGDRGIELHRWLKERRIETDFVRVGPQTRQCITVIDQSAGSQTELVEESQPLAGIDYAKLMVIIARRASRCRALVMSGTITPGGPPDLYARCTRLARRAGALAVVDAQGRALTEALKAKPALVKPNRAELGMTLGCELKNEAGVRRAMCDLHERGAQRIVVTAGKHPVLAFDGRAFWRIHSPRIIALNPIGSGDAFTAALVWRLLRGEDLGEAARWGAAAGAANALTMMAGQVGLKTVERLVKEVHIEHLRG